MASRGYFEEYKVGNYLVVKHTHVDDYSTSYFIEVYDEYTGAIEPIEEIESTWDEVDYVLESTIRRYAYQD